MTHSNRTPLPGVYAYEWHGRRYVDGVVLESAGPLPAQIEISADGTQVQRMPGRESTVLMDASGEMSVVGRRALSDAEYEQNGTTFRETSRVLGEEPIEMLGRRFTAVVRVTEQEYTGAVEGRATNTVHSIPELGVVARCHTRGLSRYAGDTAFVDQEEWILLVALPERS